MKTKVLNSLEIHRFRGFKHLNIGHLGNINLIVGKNNVGKSSLLEALQLYARRASPIVIAQILGTRDENKRQRSNRGSSFEESLRAAKYLFYGRKEIKAPIKPISIGPINSLEDRLTLDVQWFSKVSSVDGIGVLQKVLFEEYEALNDEYEAPDTSTPRFTVQIGTQREYNYPLDMSSASSSIYARAIRLEIGEITNFFIDANGLNRKEVGELWDSIALTSLEKEILAALRIVAPGVEDISVIGDPTSSRERVTIVKVVGIDEPLPIRSLGDGMQRMLGIALALVNARNGILLIDEIENGLHYSVQLDLWYLIFELARRLNVQVFATSHSWDCIKTFQTAAKEDEQLEGVLIRLEIKNGEVSTTQFDEQELAIATQEQIEVR